MTSQRQKWGPQDIRVIARRIVTVDLAFAKDIGFVEIADLEGKRVGFVKGILP